MVSVQKISVSSLIKWRYFSSKDIPIVSFETDQVVYILAEYNDKEIIIKYNKVTNYHLLNLDPRVKKLSSYDVDTSKKHVFANFQKRKYFHLL